MKTLILGDREVTSNFISSFTASPVLVYYIRKTYEGINYVVITRILYHNLSCFQHFAILRNKLFMSHLENCKQNYHPLLAC